MRIGRSPCSQCEAGSVGTGGGFGADSCARLAELSTPDMPLSNVCVVEVARSIICISQQATIELNDLPSC